MSCGRYYELRKDWETAMMLRAASTDASVVALGDQALRVLRDHARECPACEEALFGPFAETKGKRRFSVRIEGGER